LQYPVKSNLTKGAAASSETSAECLNQKAAGTCNSHCALKRWSESLHTGRKRSRVNGKIGRGKKIWIQ